jgi:hypothetical protein
MNDKELHLLKFIFVLFRIWKVEAVGNDFCEYFCALFFSCMDICGLLFFIISWFDATSTQQFIFIPCSAIHCSGSNIFCFFISKIMTPHDMLRVVSKRRLEEQNSIRTDIIH